MAERRVTVLEVWQDTLLATVNGQAAYRVRLGLNDSGTHVWERLALALATVRPKDALVICRKSLDGTLPEAYPSAYAHAVGLLRHIQACHLRLGQPDAFQGLLNQLRETYRRRRLFVQALNSEKWAE